MEYKQEILIVAEKTGFLSRAIAEQLEKYGYEVTLTELDMQKLFEVQESVEAVLLYVENEIQSYTQEILYLRDKVVEEDTPVFFIGEDIRGLRGIIPEHIIKEFFERPVDVKVSAKKIDSYLKLYGKHVKKKILVVDDSGAVLRSVKAWLEEKYQVILANSGAMAIKYLATNRPDLVLLDYEMPVVDGRQVLEMMRTEMEFSNIPVIFLTSKNDKESIMKVMELKPEGYILKSTPPKQILQEIDIFLTGMDFKK
ncbi:MAG: response regulator [Agathobacter sp.]|nr:response regulator [Agathobacter sp.]MDY4893793.1 response regulator [Agathobacter sp.]